MNAIATRPSPARALTTVVRYTLRSALPGKRWISALLVAGTSVLFGLLAATRDELPADYSFALTAGNALFMLVLPITCLVIGDAVLGAEVRSGTFAFTWMAPVPTSLIAVGRWLGGALAAGITVAIAFALAAVVAGAPELAGEVAISAAFGAGAYVAVFIAIGCITKRAAVWSLAFVIIFERLLGAALSGIAQLSPSWVSRAAFSGMADVGDDLIREGVPSGTAALVRLAVLTVIALLLANWRLRTITLSGSAD